MGRTSAGRRYGTGARIRASRRVRLGCGSGPYRAAVAIERILHPPACRADSGASPIKGNGRGIRAPVCGLFRRANAHNETPQKAVIHRFRPFVAVWTRTAAAMTKSKNSSALPATAAATTPTGTLPEPRVRVPARSGAGAHRSTASALCRTAARPQSCFRRSTMRSNVDLGSPGGRKMKL